MPPGLPTAWLTQGGAAGILSLAVVAVLVGWLVPRWTYRSMHRDLEKQVEQWQAAFWAADERARELAAQNALLTEVARTADAILRALQAASSSLPPAPPSRLLGSRPSDPAQPGAGGGP